MVKINFNLRTLTPIWTGDVNGECKEIKETGIIGSMRWWYEAIVRGMGGYVCNPANINCEFDIKGYEKCLKDNKSSEEALEIGLKKVCPACQLFGCTGWKRQFQLQIGNAPKTPLHFRTSVIMNKSWLKRIFGGINQDINNLYAFYGEIAFRFILRTNDSDYVKSQLNMLLRIISEYGGLGAKIQHGFGQIQIMDTIPDKDKNLLIKNGLKELSKRINSGEFIKESEFSSEMAYNLDNFICLNYDLFENSIRIYKDKNNHLGNASKIGEDRYLPCSFDLRYKSKNSGMRIWLEKTIGWNNDDLNSLMGVSEKRGIKINDKDRASSHIFFGMPYKINNNYRLRIFGFAPPDVLKPNELKSLCEDYMHDAFGMDCNPIMIALGKEIIKLNGSD